MPENAVVVSLSLVFALSSLGAAQLPMVFEPNAGQAAQDVRFLGRGGAEQIALLDGGGFRAHGVAIRLAGANPRAVGVGLQPLPGRSNYFSGHGAARWHAGIAQLDRKSTRLNSSHLGISYAVFCLKKKKKN